MAMNKQTFKLKTKRGLHRGQLFGHGSLLDLEMLQALYHALENCRACSVAFNIKILCRYWWVTIKIPTDFITYWWWVEVKFVIPQHQNIELHDTENSFRSQSLVFKIWLVAIELGLRSSPFVLPLPHWIGAFFNKDWQGYIENNKKTQQEMTKETNMEN